MRTIKKKPKVIVEWPSHWSSLDTPFTRSALSILLWARNCSEQSGLDEDDVIITGVAAWLRDGFEKRRMLSEKVGSLVILFGTFGLISPKDS